MAKYVRTKRKGRLLTRTIAELPDDLIHGIFKWLPPRDLCTCAYVCSRWWHIARADVFWNHHYQLLVNKLGNVKVDRSLNSTYKQIVLRTGMKQRDNIVRSMFHQNLDFRKHLKLTMLRLSVKLEVHERDKVISVHKEMILPKTLCQQHCELFVELCDTDIFPQNLQQIIIYCAVPLFPEKLLSQSESPRQFVELKRFDLKSIREACQCNRFSAQNIFLLHNCIEGLLIGQWPKSSLAFISGAFTLNELRHTLKRVSNLKGANFVNEQRLGDFPDTFDLCGHLLGTDGFGNIVFSNSWRSFEIKGDHKILLNSCEHGSHVPFEREPVSKIKVGAFEAKLQDAFILRFLACRANGDHLCDLSGWVFLTPATNEQIQFGEEDGDRYRFELKDTKATLTGLVLRIREKGRMPKLIELELRLRKC